MVGQFCNGKAKMLKKSEQKMCFAQRGVFNICGKSLHWQNFELEDVKSCNEGRIGDETDIFKIDIEFEDDHNESRKMLTNSFASKWAFQQKIPV